MDEASSCSSWSWEQEKDFENALAIHSEDLSDRWEKIAEVLPGKTIEEIKQHYELLIEDIDDIESGRVPLPKYASSSEGVGDEGSSGSKKGGSHSGHSHGDSGHGGKGSRSEQERRKGVAWTEDEHRLFLLGLDKYGKGDWRSISRNYVISRTPTQVASHAQKYFIRLNSMNKDRRRASIHDITSVGNNSNNNNNSNNGETSTPQGPITGQTSGPHMVMPGGKPAKSSPAPGVGVFSTAIGQPAIGTPVNLPVPPGLHMAYGIRAPVAGSVVPGGPMNLPPMTYPMPHTSAHR